MNKTKKLISLGLLIALSVILTRFLSIQLPTLRIGFGFLPIAFASIMFGPLLGGICGALSDILGMMIFPYGSYFPGFTISAFISGIIYGLFLYKKPKSLTNTIIAVVLINLFVDLLLNTFWLSILMKKGVLAILFPRIIKTAILFPIQTSSIYIGWKYIGKAVYSNFLYEKI